MDKYIYDENNGLLYERWRQLLSALPDAAGAEACQHMGSVVPVLFEGALKRFLYSLLLKGRLDNHFAKTNWQAEEMLDRLIKQMAEREGVTEHLKANDYMAWDRPMNNIRARAKEVVNAELICTYSKGWEIIASQPFLKNYVPN